VLGATYIFLFVMNLFWNLFNLLPIWPMDGGRVCRELCSLAGSRRPDALAMTISLVTAGLLTVYGLLNIFGRDTAIFDQIPVLNWFRPGTLMTIWFAMFAVQSWMILQQLNRQSAGWRDDDDDSPPWRR
jgi:Zn-dependent protease